MNPNGLFVSSSGNVGIGTTSPSTILHINGSSATLTIADSTSYASGVGGKLSLHGNYRSLGDITEGGYVKISKTNSTDGDYGFDMIFATSNYTAGVAERLRISSTGVATFSSSIAATQFTSQGGRGTSYGYKLPDWQIYNTTSGNALAFSNYTTDLLTITSGGNVLVGTISGSSVFPVTISGDGSTKSGAIQFKNNGVDVLYLGTPAANDSVNIQMYNPNSGYIRFATNSEERLRITSGGDIRITSNGTTNAATLELVSSATPSSGSSISVSYLGAGSYGPLTFGTGGTERMRITSTGNVNIGSATAASYGLLGSSNLATSMGITFHNGSTYSKVGGVISVQESAGSHALSFWARSGGDEGEKMRITNTGNILINQTSALAGVPVSVEISGVGSSTPTLQASYNVYANHGAANTSWRGYYVFHRSRGTTSGSVTAVAAEDFLGTIRWNGADGTGEIIAAEINAKVDGTVGTNDMPTRLEFSTTADGGSGPTERLRINSAGNVRILNVGSQLQFDTDGSGGSTTLATNGLYDFRIYNARGGASNIDVSTYEIGFGMNGSTNRYRMGTNSFYPAGDNAYTCGASGQRWSAIWSANGTIQTSDARQKKDITPTNLGLNFIMALNPVSYKWKVGKNVVTSDGERIDENGATQSNDIITPIEGTRTHYGLIAQEVKEALGDVDFGGYVHDEETDTLALRSDQFISPLIKAIQELNTKLDAANVEIEALKSK
jgi:hypothetical protein